MQTLVAEILAAWRRADRLCATLPPESPEHAAAQEACGRLRDLYRNLTASDAVEELTLADARAVLADMDGTRVA